MIPRLEKKNKAKEKGKRNLVVTTMVWGITIVLIAYPYLEAPNECWWYLWFLSLGLLIANITRDMLE